MVDPVEMLNNRLKAPNSTQAELADQIGISPQFLSEILKGKRNPSKTVLTFLGLEKVITYRPRQAVTLPQPPTGTDRRTRNRRRA